MNSDYIEVAVGVILSSCGNKVLLSQRHERDHYAGLWEFPGGKLELGEQIFDALERELQEEIDLVIKRARPLIKIKYCYADFNVLLHVWKVEVWQGQPTAREGQVLCWVENDRLNEYPLLAANYNIISAIRLPSLYAISPDLLKINEDPIPKIKRLLDSGLRLFQLRCYQRSGNDYADLVFSLARLFESYNAFLILNNTWQETSHYPVSGVHINSEQLMSLKERPLGADYLIGGSCHSPDQIKHAERLGFDFVTLSPVCRTKSHLDKSPLGWNKFEQWVEHTCLPVYALGGMCLQDMEKSWCAGGQGIAMLSGIWDDETVKPLNY